MVDQPQVGDERAAQAYDAPGSQMFSDDVLGSTVEIREPGHLLVDVLDPPTALLASHHVRFAADIAGGRSAGVARSPRRHIWPSAPDPTARPAGSHLESRSTDRRGSPFTADSTSRISADRFDSGE